MNRTLGRIGSFIQRRCYSIDYLVNSIPKPGATYSTTQSEKPASKKQASPKKPKAKAKAKKPVPSSKLIDQKLLLDGFEPFTPAQYSRAQHVFRAGKPVLSWTLADYDEIPDVKYARLARERELKYNNLDPYHKNETTENMLNSRKTFGIKPDLLQPLPEVLVIGHTNAGKSSLINRLLLDKEKLKRQDQLAYVSARAGYTKTMNCFTISNKFRIVDSPGFGWHGEEVQGKMVIDYIEKRDLLKMVYFLVDTTAGLREEDTAIVDHLIELGVPFSIIFTKVDNPKVVEKLALTFEVSCRKFISDDNGVRDIRASILEATGI
ncbi:MIOREX complex component 8 [Candida viswanathii]|uniref:MIOREX complex component 8 n=1 Tax=Candida viswanathii TaxID=5486 RepID=A0A367YCB4_9ASCO|nr:MIOREX complex component 8 [Candida viswanathii]